MEETAPVVPPRARRRWPWITLATFAAAAIGVRAALPFGLVWAAERGLREAVGLPLEIANVDLGLLRGELLAEDLAIGRAGGGAREKPLLKLARLSARLSWPALLKGRIRLSELTVEEPVLRLARLADGSLEDPLPPRASAEPPAAQEARGAGWPLAVDELRVAGFDLELADRGRDAPALGFAVEELTLRELSLEGDDVTLGGIGLRGPRLRVERSFVLGPRPQPDAASAPAAPAEAPAAAAPAGAAAGGPRYRLQRVAVEGAGISLLTENGPLDLELDFAAEDVGARAGETFPIRLGLRVGGGELHAEGRAGLAPPSFDGTLRWSEMPVPLFVVAARPDLMRWVRSCRSEGELRVTARLAPGANAEEPAEARLSGHFAVRDLALGDPADQEVEIRWSALEGSLREAVVPLGGGDTPIRVSLEQLRLLDPALRYARPSPALDALLGAPPPAAEPAAEAAPSAAQPPPAEPAAAPFEIEIDAFELRGGSLAFADATLGAPYRGALRKLSVAAREVRWPALRAHQIRVRGVAPERAPFTLTGSLDGPRGELTFEVQRLTLPALDPYAAGAGYSFARGEATLRTKLVLDPARYASENDLLLHDLRLDSADAGRFEQQFGTSLDFTLALLRDPSGDIRLPVPLVVERESLRLGLRPIVLGALRAALVGVVSSPLKALGAALPRGSGGDVDLTSLASDPGAAELAPSESARVDAVANLLRSRPLLALEITGRSGEADRPVLAERSAVERAGAGESLPEVEGAGFLARRRVAEALRARGRGEAPELSAEDAELLARTIAATPVPRERFEALARARAAALREALVTGRGLEAGRVRAAEDVSEGVPGVELELAAAVGEVVGAPEPAP